MKKIFMVLVLIGIGYYIHKTGKIETFEKIDLDQFKKSAIENIKKEKTINAVNSKREADRNEINEILD